MYSVMGLVHFVEEVLILSHRRPSRNDCLSLLVASYDILMRCSCSFRCVVVMLGYVTLGV